MSAEVSKRVQVSLFSKMPIKWIQDGGLVSFSSRPTATASKDSKLQNACISALKLYMTLCMKTTFGTGEVKTTYPKLIALSGMSRPTIARALKRLVDEGLITKRSKSLREGSQIYINGWLEQGYYGMLPKRWLHDENQGAAILKLIEFNYSTTSLHALKVYLAIIAFRDSRRDGLAVISYNSIARYTDIPRYRVAEAITKLYDMNLISYRQADFTDNDDEVDRTNRYLVKGLNLTWSARNLPIESRKVVSKKPSQNEIKTAISYVANGTI